MLLFFQNKKKRLVVCRRSTTSRSTAPPPQLVDAAPQLPCGDVVSPPAAAWTPHHRSTSPPAAAVTPRQRPMPQAGPCRAALDRPCRAAPGSGPAPYPTAASPRTVWIRAHELGDENNSTMGTRPSIAALAHRATASSPRRCSACSPSRRQRSPTGPAAVGPALGPRGVRIGIRTEQREKWTE